MRGFLDVVESMQREGDVWRADIGHDWLQGRTCYGGMIAACAAQALGELTGEAAPLVSLDGGFFAPISPGQVELRAQVLRAGRYTTQAAVEVWSKGVMSARFDGVFGTRRESAVEVAAVKPAPSMALSDAPVLPFIEGVTPQFTKHFAYHWTEGGFPFTGTAQAVLGGYVRHMTRHNWGAPSILGLVDAWPAPVLPLAEKPVAASTVRWSCHLLNDPPEGFVGAWWYRAEAVASRGGYATTVARLYAGEVCVAWSEQLVTVFG
jgi:hypothetical protein